PASVALPVTFRTSNVPGAVPPTSTRRRPPALCTYAPSIVSVPGEQPGATVPSFTSWGVAIVCVPCSVPCAPMVTVPPAVTSPPGQSARRPVPVMPTSSVLATAQAGVADDDATAADPGPSSP